MVEHSKFIKWGLKPYSDGSGFQYYVGFEAPREATSTASVVIEGPGGTAYIDAKDWQDVFDAASNILRFTMFDQPRTVVEDGETLFAKIIRENERLRELCIIAADFYGRGGTFPIDGDEMRNPDESFNNLQLRFHLAAKLNLMRYGEAYRLTADQVQRAWPPTGDYDPTDEGVFRALALMNGGHRPESSYTSLERIQNDLDDSFRVTEEPITGNYMVSRNPHACPKCHGSKKTRQWMPMKAASVADCMAVGMETAVDTRWVDCDCTPEKR